MLYDNFATFCLYVLQDLFLVHYTGQQRFDSMFNACISWFMIKIRFLAFMYLYVMYTYVQLCYISYKLIYFSLFYFSRGSMVENWKPRIKLKRRVGEVLLWPTNNELMMTKCVMSVLPKFFYRYTRSRIVNIRVEPYLVSVFHDDNHARHCICRDSFY